LSRSSSHTLRVVFFRASRFPFSLSLRRVPSLVTSPAFLYRRGWLRFFVPSFVLPPFSLLSASHTHFSRSIVFPRLSPSCCPAETLHLPYPALIFLRSASYTRLVFCWRPRRAQMSLVFLVCQFFKSVTRPRGRHERSYRRTFSDRSPLFSPCGRHSQLLFLEVGPI